MESFTIPLPVTSSSKSIIAVESTRFWLLTSSGRTRPRKTINYVCSEKVTLDCRFVAPRFEPDTVPCPPPLHPILSSSG